MARETNQETTRRNQQQARSAAGAQGTGASTARNTGQQRAATSANTASRSDRERAIDTTREQGAQGRGSTALSRRGRHAPWFGAGFGGDPFSLMQRMAEDMNSLFEQLGFGSAGFGLTPSFGSSVASPRTSGMGNNREDGRGSRQGGGVLARSGAQSLWSPELEMFQRGDQLVVRADLPGVKKDDVQVEVEDDVLTIRGERREEHEENEEGVYRSERSYGQFYRAIPLPEGVNPEQCEAHFDNGVLEITLKAPAEQQRQRKRIEVR